MDTKVVYCNNCGNIGHLYKQCRQPILSYGIILYEEGTGENKIVMIERKDSLSYIEFLRGKYKSIYHTDYIKLLFSRFSKAELDKVMNNNFDTLWKELWIHTETINNRVKKEYHQSKKKFENLKKGYTNDEEFINLESLIKNIKDDEKYLMNEWEIPKGRRNQGENNRDCAIREFFEETNIPKDKYILLENIVPLVEEYKSFNGVSYKHIYYIAKIKQKCLLEIDYQNKEQYTEIKNIKWLSQEQCLTYIRKYDDSKKAVINSFFNFLNNYKKQFRLIQK